MRTLLRRFGYWRVRRMTAAEWYAADCPPWRDPVELGAVVIVKPERCTKTTSIGRCLKPYGHTGNCKIRYGIH